MKAIEIVGAERAAAARCGWSQRDEPTADQVLTGGEGVVVEVHATGVSFPELLQTRGLYQIKPPTPFVPGQRGRRDRPLRAGRRARQSG